MIYCHFFFSRRSRHTGWAGDWSSDVFFFFLFLLFLFLLFFFFNKSVGEREVPVVRAHPVNRKSVVWGKGLDLGVRRIIKKKNKCQHIYNLSMPYLQLMITVNILPHIRLRHHKHNKSIQQHKILTPN